MHISNICPNNFKPLCNTEIPSYGSFQMRMWHGRMLACRGTGASLSPKELADREKEHTELLNRIAPEEFDVAHYAAMVELKSLKNQ